MSSLARYRRVMAAPQARTLVVASLLARLPIGIQSLALVLFLREQTGSFATAGGVTAAFALLGGLGSPLQGRLVDRVGQTRVLVPCVLVHAIALAVLVPLAISDASPAVLGLLAALAGAAIPPVWACLRPLLVGLLDSDELLAAAYALDAILIEVVFILGPLVTAVLVAAFSPAFAVATGAVLALVGTLWFAAVPASRAWRSDGVTRGIAGPLASSGMRTMVIAAMPLGVCFGALEVSLPAFARDHGGGNVAGVLFALMSVGSVIGGLMYGALADRLGTLRRGYLMLLAALPPAFALLALASELAPMLVLVTIAGFVIAPLTAAESQMTAAVAPVGTTTEAFTWVLMSTVIGVAAGNAIAGALVEQSGWRSAVLWACLAALVLVTLAIARGRTLKPRAVAAPAGYG